MQIKAFSLYSKQFVSNNLKVDSDQFVAFVDANDFETSHNKSSSIMLFELNGYPIRMKIRDLNAYKRSCKCSKCGLTSDAVLFVKPITQTQNKYFDAKFYNAKHGEFFTMENNSDLWCGYCLSRKGNEQKNKKITFSGLDRVIEVMMSSRHGSLVNAAYDYSREYCLKHDINVVSVGDEIKLDMFKNRKYKVMNITGSQTTIICIDDVKVAHPINVNRYSIELFIHNGYGTVC